MLIEVTIKATIDISQFGCSNVVELEDILIDADEITLTVESMLDGEVDGYIHIASCTED